MDRKALVALGLIGVVMLSGCSKNPTSLTGGSSTAPVVESISAGSLFLKSNLKVKVDVKDTSYNPARSCTLEFYVDKDGNGKGLVGFGDKVLDVGIVKDRLYILVESDLVVGIEDITGRGVLSSLDLEGVSDLIPLGFTVSPEGTILSYSALEGSVSVNTQFAQSVNTFDTLSITPTTSYNFSDAITYILDYYAEKNVTAEVEDPEPEVKDFYINSKYGITIDGTVYSVGDTCNTDTYFAGRTPEGLVDSHAYKQDERVDFVHASYLSNTGRSVFVLAGNYVQSIQTNTDFEFLGIKRGTDEKELKALLGYNLNSKEEESFVPIDENLVITGHKSGTYFGTVGNLNVEFRCDKGELVEIYIEQPLDFKA